MGSKQSTKQKTEIINDNRVKNVLKNINKNINESTMKIVQENLQETASEASLTQKVVIEDVTAGGDIGISGVGQKASVKISVSSLADSEMKQELVNETMNKMQTKLKEQISMTQAQASKKGEKMVSDAIKAVSSTMKSFVPGSKSSNESETSIKNLMSI